MKIYDSSKKNQATKFLKKKKQQQKNKNISSPLQSSRQITAAASWNCPASVKKIHQRVQNFDRKKKPTKKKKMC